MEDIAPFSSVCLFMDHIRDKVGELCPRSMYVRLDVYELPGNLVKSPF